LENEKRKKKLISNEIMSLITLQRSPSIENELTKSNETRTNHKQQYLEAMRQPNENSSLNSDSDSKIESFDKEFNFQDLKEIYATPSLPVTLTRKASMPTASNKVLTSTSHVRINMLEDVMNSSMSSVNRQLFEKYFLVKDAALILPRRSKEAKRSIEICSVPLDHVAIDHNSHIDSAFCVTEQRQQDEQVRDV